MDWTAQQDVPADSDNDTDNDTDNEPAARRENVWGTWNGINPRAGVAIRRVQRDGATLSDLPASHLFGAVTHLEWNQPTGR